VRNFVKYEVIFFGRIKFHSGEYMYLTKWSRNVKRSFILWALRYIKANETYT